MNFDHFLASIEIYRVKRHDGTRSREVSRARSPSPYKPATGKDVSWREKMGATAQPTQRKTLDVEQPRVSSNVVSEPEERRDPPKVTEKLLDLTVFQGASAKFSCQINGKPVPTVEWLKNGEVNVIHY